MTENAEHAALSAERLAEIRALVDGTTPGEWQADLLENCVYTTTDDEEQIVVCCAVEEDSEGNFHSRDVEFIAAAPGVVRELLADRAQKQQWLDERDDLLYSLKQMIDSRADEARIISRLKLYLSGD